MRKICLKIHKWLALPFGLFMAILCFTGFLIIAVKDLSLLLGMEESVKPFLSSVTRLHRWPCCHGHFVYVHGACAVNGCRCVVAQEQKDA